MRLNHLFIFVLCLTFPLISSGEEIELRVMTFNIWYGGEQFSFGQVADVIRAASPDLIGIQEPDGNLRRLASAIGYSYVDEKRNLISRYPLFDPDTADRNYLYTRVLVRPGKIVALANVHLTSSPFGPDMLRDGKTPQEVIANEMRVRVPEVEPYARTLAEAIANGIPVFFTGDFNTPSHLDDSRIVWPVTKKLVDAGLHDSYREAHPDAAAKPGLTWTPGYPHPWVKPDEVFARIDYIWSGGSVKTIESQIIGEPGNPAVNISVAPYPSDHRAVVSTFRVTPAPAPPMIGLDAPSFWEGEDFLVRFQTPNFEDWGVVIVPKGNEASSKAVISAKGPNLLSTRPSFRFGSLGIAPGSYDAVLVDAKGKELARTTFSILARGAEPELRLEKSSFKKGESIKVSFRNAPGMKNDWIGVYKANDPDMYGGYLSFIYTGAKVEGSIVLPALEPGDYELRLMREDSYVMLARVRFTVTG